ncbi:hypothetical protein VP01_866g2 [Puccinia sorghi]|uniref:Ino eighty subunit 1 n=1 Tax=Puccinia sorghi TaxID=27349 RepID=A0A0L6U8S0_9BASI|nr:hypothetical protein VP01_866g2 [Puccinia sorghi]
MAPPKKAKANQPANQATPNASKDNPGWALKKLDELYVETLSRFSKAAKSTVRQLDDNPNWATNFCIASFLINIGRINTTVAFYPELRAYMRTYHPIPCLQKDEYCQTNLQDAPRIKTMLKSCQLPSEFNNEPDSLPEIAKRSALGYRPPTTVVNLIFELFSVEPYVSMKYFPEGFVLHDLFSPTTIPTKLRAYAFLWLMHHFLEDPSALNDFAHESKVEAFQLARLEDIQPDSSLGDTPENVDTEEEIQWGKDMQNYRREFLKKWRGEEGIGFVDDLGTGFIAPLIEDSQLTKKQKIMVQNYAQTAIEGEDGQHSQSQLAKGSTPGSCIPPSALTGPAKFDNRKGVGKEGAKNKTVSKARLTHIERLQSAVDVAWRRYQTDVSEDLDVAYDSDELIRQPHPTWKPKELKHRLVGFAFPVTTPSTVPPSEEEKKDKVIRFIGVKRRTQATTDNSNNNMAGCKGLNAVSGVGPVGKESGLLPPGSGAGSGAHANMQTNPPKLKRRRKVNPPVPSSNTAQSILQSAPITAPPKTDADLLAQGAEVPMHTLSRPPA